MAAVDALVALLAQTDSSATGLMSMSRGRPHCLQAAGEEEPARLSESRLKERLLELWALPPYHSRSELCDKDRNTTGTLCSQVWCMYGACMVRVYGAWMSDACRPQKLFSS